MPHHTPNLPQPRQKNLLCLPTTAMPPSLRTSPLFTQTVPPRKKCIIHNPTLTLDQGTNIKQSPQPIPDLLPSLPTFPLLLTSTTPTVSQPIPRIIWSLRNQELQDQNINPIHRDILLFQSTTSILRQTNHSIRVTVSGVVLPLRTHLNNNPSVKRTQNNLPTTTRSLTTHPTNHR
jgi:hypothetical protein